MGRSPRGAVGTPSGQSQRQEKADSRIQRKGRVEGTGGAGAPTEETWAPPTWVPPCVLPLVPSLQAETKGKGSTGHVGRPGRPSGLGSEGRLQFMQEWGGQQVRGQDPVTQFSSVQSLSRVRLFATHESQHARPPCPSSLRLTSIESVMPSSHLILCHPLLLLPPIPPSISVFSSWRYLL